MSEEGKPNGPSYAIRYLVRMIKLAAVAASGVGLLDKAQGVINHLSNEIARGDARVPLIVLPALGVLGILTLIIARGRESSGK